MPALRKLLLRASVHSILICERILNTGMRVSNLGTIIIEHALYDVHKNGLIIKEFGMAEAF